MYEELIDVLEFIFKETYYEGTNIKIGNVSRNKGREVAILFRDTNKEHKFLITEEMDNAANITLYFISDKRENRLLFLEEMENIYRAITRFNPKHSFEFNNRWVKFREGVRGLTNVGVNEYEQMEMLIDLNIYY